MAILKRLQKKWAPTSRHSRFQDLVSKYGKTLEEYSHMTFGRPRSKLPGSIDDIKEAIIRVALESLDEPEFIDKLKAGYMELATFIDDEAANSYNKAWLNFTKTDKDSGPDLVLAWDGMEAANKAQGAILEEIKKNEVVFNEVLGKLKLKIN